MAHHGEQWNSSWAGKACASSLMATLLGSWWQARRQRERRAARPKRRV